MPADTVNGLSAFGQPTGLSILNILNSCGIYGTVFLCLFSGFLKLIYLLIKFLVFRHQLFYAIQNTQKLYFSARMHSEQDQKNVVKSRKREKANGNGAK